MQQKWWAAGELLLATTIWGFGFTACIWALKSFDSISISVMRFGCAAIIGFLILFFRPNIRVEINRANLINSFWPGLFLGASLCFQSWGLEFTTATKSGFITTLYVVFVPIMDALINRRRLRYQHWVWVLIALTGTALMIQFQFDKFNKGDLLTLLCALTCTGQIITIGRVSKSVRSVFAFNSFQCLWAVAISLAFWPFYGHVNFNFPTLQSGFGLASLTLLSTLVAFALQVKAQKVLSPSLSSLIFLLESPFAAIFAIFFLHEQLTLWQAAGGVLIFVSALQATRGEA